MQITVFDLPKERWKVTQHRAIYFLKNNLLVACDDESVIGGIAERLAGQINRKNRILTNDALLCSGKLRNGR